jgi:hypothetical protein
MVECLIEERWIAAAKEGGTMGDLEFAFRWSTARDWPCPDIASPPIDDQTGWYTFWLKTTTRNYSGGGTEARDIKIPKHIRKYIAMMYVDWKLMGDSY